MPSTVITTAEQNILQLNNKEDWPLICFRDGGRGMSEFHFKPYGETHKYDLEVVFIVLTYWNHKYKTIFFI